MGGGCQELKQKGFERLKAQWFVLLESYDTHSLFYILKDHISLAPFHPCISCEIWWGIRNKLSMKARKMCVFKLPKRRYTNLESILIGDRVSKEVLQISRNLDPPFRADLILYSNTYLI